MELLSPPLKKGFTLVEALVALGVMVVAFLGPLALLSQSLSAAPYTRAGTLAQDLAREPVEYLTHVRDVDLERAVNFLVSGGNPEAFQERLRTMLAPCFAQDCEVDPLAVQWNQAVRACNPSGGCYVAPEAGSGFYRPVNTKPSKGPWIQRWIRVEKNHDPSADPSYKIRVTVRYSDGRHEGQTEVVRFLPSFAEAAVALYLE